MHYAPKSTTKEARELIAKEIYTRYSETGFLPRCDTSKIRILKAIKRDAEACCKHERYRPSDWRMGIELVNAGCFACYYSDQLVLLEKIYGKTCLDWEGDKIHRVYASLIGREYARLLKKYRIE